MNLLNLREGNLLIWSNPSSLALGLDFTWTFSLIQQANEETEAQKAWMLVQEAARLHLELRSVCQR